MLYNYMIDINQPFLQRSSCKIPSEHVRCRISRNFSRTWCPPSIPAVPGGGSELPARGNMESRNGGRKEN